MIDHVILHIREGAARSYFPTMQTPNNRPSGYDEKGISGLQSYFVPLDSGIALDVLHIPRLTIVHNIPRTYVYNSSTVPVVEYIVYIYT